MKFGQTHKIRKQLKFVTDDKEPEKFRPKVILEFSDLSFIPPFIFGLILIIMHKNIATALVGIFILLFISIGFIYLLRTRVKIAKLKHELEVEIKDIHRKLSENFNRLYE